jgi:5S rRNA maturation endonuclease (ribonuclease M5)
MGEVNLNSIVYNPIISLEDILKHVTQEQIYSYYIGEDVSKLGFYHSPLRNDRVPSFALYFHRDKRNILMFRDMATKESGDCVIMVMKLFNIDYKKALLKIAVDLGLGSLTVDIDKVKVQYTKIEQKEKVELGIKIRKWQIQDKNYWEQFGITKTTLQKFDVYPISHVFYNENPFTIKTLAYAYLETKDNQNSFKIYQPLEEKKRKWINNANYTVHQGYTKLPETGDLLIITKSLKDVMSLHDCMGINSIGLQSESVMMKHTVMQEYRRRFKNVICLFDNDEAGRKLSEDFTNEYGIYHFFVPNLSDVTDFSDLVKKVGKEEASRITQNLINTII